MNLLPEFESFITENDLLKDEDHVLIAVSGGVDSMVLLDLFQRSGRSFGVAHCNFQLRGAESDEDERMVSDYCKSRDIHFDVKSFFTEEHASETGQSIQMAARQLRYDWFRQVMDANNYSKLATAHHSDDNLETILFNITKGTGYSGVAGIPVKEKRRIRPLLFASRSQVMRYAAENKIVWREDQSNTDTKYARSRIRREVIPVLEQINPSLRSGFHKTGVRFRESKEIIRSYLKNQLSEILSHDGDTLKVEKHKLLDTVGATTLLYEITNGYGFNYESCKQIIASSDSIGAIFQSDTHMLNVDRDFLLIKRSSSPDTTKVEILPETKGFHLNGKVYSIEKLNHKTSFSSESSEAYLDYNKLSFPLSVRRWEPGDKFVPLGMEGSKKVSDFLVDQKVPLIDKDNVTVLISKGEIVWLVGYRIDDRFKIDDSSGEILKISPL